MGQSEVLSNIDKKDDQLNEELMKVDLKKWSTKHVSKWYSYISSSIPNHEKYENIFEKMSGKELDSISKEEIEKLGVTNKEDRKAIYKIIKKVQTTRHFNYGLFVVNKKIQTAWKKGGMCKMKREDLDFLTKALGNEEEMIKTYLNVKNVHEKLKKFVAKEENFTEPEKYEEFGDCGESDPQTFENELLHRIRIPLKILLVEFELEKDNNSRFLFSPVLEYIPSLSGKFCKLHPIIIIGDIYLDFNSSSLCVPKALHKEMGILLGSSSRLDVPIRVLLRDISYEDTLKKIANVVTKWNTGRYFSASKNIDDDKGGNSVDFLNDICKDLSISFDISSITMKLFNEIKMKGYLKSCIFRPSKEFIETFKTEEEYVFSTRRELMDCCNKCIKISEIAFEMDFKNDLALITNYNFVIWMRYIWDRDNKDYEIIKDKMGFCKLF